jgi:hypothetical protein
VVSAIYEAEPITPTPADRETYIAFNNLPGVHLAEVRAGKWDNTTGMQIIARHAQAARLEGAMEVSLANIRPIHGNGKGPNFYSTKCKCFGDELSWAVNGPTREAVEELARGFYAFDPAVLGGWG